MKQDDNTDWWDRSEWGDHDILDFWEEDPLSPKVRCAVCLGLGVVDNADGTGPCYVCNGKGEI